MRMLEASFVAVPGDDLLYPSHAPESGTAWLEDQLASRSVHSLSEYEDRGFCDWFRAHTRGIECVETIPRRRAVIRTFGFAIPCREALDLAASFGPVVEVGAGTGYWSRLLSDRGVDVIATDDLSGRYGFRHAAHFPIVPQDAAESVREHTGRAVLIVWPSYDERWAERVLDAMGPGQVVVYVGEWGGCTATDAFHDRLDGPDFEKLVEQDIPVWGGMHDRMWVFRRSS